MAGSHEDIAHAQVGLARGIHPERGEAEFSTRQQTW